MEFATVIHGLGHGSHDEFAHLQLLQYGSKLDTNGPTFLGWFLHSVRVYIYIYILCTYYYILYTIYYILYTIYYILYTIYYILYTKYYILYSMVFYGILWLVCEYPRKPSMLIHVGCPNRFWTTTSPANCQSLKMQLVQPPNHRDPSQVQW